MRNVLIITYLIIAIITSATAQNSHGEARNRARNDHSGNLIRVTFHNHGMLGSIRGDNSLHYSGEWPINSGHIYIMSFRYMFTPT